MSIALAHPAAVRAEIVRAFRLLLALAVGLCFVVPAQAHSVGTSSVRLTTDSSETIQVRVDLGLRDLEFAVGLDSDGDGRITWGEVTARSAALGAYVQSRLSISRGAAACELSPLDIAIDNRDDEVFAAFSGAAACSAAGVLTVRSDLLFDIDDSHRTLITVTGDLTATSVLTQGTRTLTTTVSDGIWSSFGRFVGQGIWHIWIGFDHLAFLMLLLLPLLRRQEEERHAAGDIKKILKVVTAFTAAHTITLICAALGFVDLPSRWVEAAIAASIVIAAIANLSNAAARFGVAMAFGFGLIHGLGFAGALADLVSDTASRIAPLLGFNLGVELGQLVVVAAVFPVLFLWRSALRHRDRTVLAGSLLMGALGVAWFVERTVLA